MLRKTIPNIFFLIAVNLLVKPFWIFGIDRVVQNNLGEKEYGLYFALFNFSIFFQILNDFGIQNYNSRKIAQEPALLNTYFISILSSKLLLSFVYILVSLTAFILLGYSWVQHGHIFMILLVNQVLISTIFYLRSNLAGLHKFKLDSLFSVLDKFFMILFVGSILYFNILNIPLTITNFIWAQTFAFGLNALLLLAVVSGFAKVNTFSVDWELMRRIFNESFPFALSIFLMSIYLRMDAIMIERLLGAEGAFASGVYAQSFRIIDALNMIGILFANILLPTYSRAFKEDRNVRGLIKKATLWMALIAVPITLLVGIKGQAIIELLYTNHPLYSGNILRVLILSFAAYSFMHIYSSLLTAAGQLRTLNLIFSFGILLNLVANFILIPKMGALGAAITTSCSQWIILGVIIIQTIRFLRIKNPV